MKKLLILSPYFPPDNTADMHRVRQSLEYYAEMGWEAQVLCVASEFTEAYKDQSLLQTIPENIPVHSVQAVSPRITRKIGLGSIALRGLIPLYRKGNEIIRQWKPDLIFISTTQFPAMILGAWWRKKFRIPYVLDFQDPWHHDHYLNLPADQRPPKFWLSYRMNKYLEPIAVKKASGLIAVSQAYITTLKERYPEIQPIPASVIPFGASPGDIRSDFKQYLPDYFPASQEQNIRIVYTGVINQEMIPVMKQFLLAFQQLINEREELKNRCRLYFIGTSYGSGVHRKYKLESLIQELHLSDFVTEIPERVSFLSALQIQKHADLLLLPGTTDKNYIASKLAPYLISGRPIFSIFRKSSDAYDKLIVQPRVVLFPFEDEQELQSATSDIQVLLEKAINNLTQMAQEPVMHPELYSAQALTRRQAELFEKVMETRSSLIGHT